MLTFIEIKKIINDKIKCMYIENNVDMERITLLIKGLKGRKIKPKRAEKIFTRAPSFMNIVVSFYEDGNPLPIKNFLIIAFVTENEVQYLLLSPSGAFLLNDNSICILLKEISKYLEDVKPVDYEVYAARQEFIESLILSQKITTN